MTPTQVFDAEYRAMMAESRFTSLVDRIGTFGTRRWNRLTARLYNRLRGNGEGCEFGMDWRTMSLIKPLTTRVYRAALGVDENGKPLDGE